MTRVAMRVLVLLGYLVGCAEAMDGEAAGRYSLELVGFVVAAFLLYVAFSGAIMAVFSRTWRRKKRSVEHRGVSEVASVAARSGHDSRGAREARP
jgi:hypothetical protein